MAQTPELEEAQRIGQIGRSIILALARNQQGNAAVTGVSIDLEATLDALMYVAAGLIGQNTNLRTPRDVRLEAVCTRWTVKRRRVAGRGCSILWGPVWLLKGLEPQELGRRLVERPNANAHLHAFTVC